MLTEPVLPQLPLAGVPRQRRDGQVEVASDLALWLQVWAPVSHLPCEFSRARLPHRTPAPPRIVCAELSWAGLVGEVPEGFAVGVGVLKAHLLQLAAAVQLIVPAVGLLPEVLHVDPDQHLPQLHKVAVGFIFNCIAAVGVLERKVTRSRNGQNETGNV